MGGRSMPWECEHGVTVDGGDFCESEICKQCEAKYNLMSNSQPTEQAERIAALEAVAELVYAYFKEVDEIFLCDDAHQIIEALQAAGYGEGGK